MSTTELRHVLIQALRNDNRGGIISEADARAMVRAALEAVEQADDPAAAHAESQRFMRAALELVGSDDDASSLLRGFERRGRKAVARGEASIAATATLHGTLDEGLPAEVEATFRELVEDDEALGELDGVLTLGAPEAIGEGLRFTWTADGQRGQVYAVFHGGGWVVSPKPLVGSSIAAAAQVLFEALDEMLAPMLGAAEGWGDELRAWHALWPEQVDPLGLRRRFPLVLRFHNPFGSDHGLYVGLDPESGAAEAGAFN